MTNWCSSPAERLRSARRSPRWLDFGSKLGNRRRALSGRCGPTTCGSNFGQVDLHHLLVERRRDRSRPRHRRVSKSWFASASWASSARSVARRYVAMRSSYAEDRGRGAQLGAHVGDGRLACARERASARPEILDDPVRAAARGENARELEDDVFGRGPAIELARETHADDLRGWSVSQGRSTITSTASAPPTPMASIPRPPAFGVWESVPMSSPRRGTHSSPR